MKFSELSENIRQVSNTLRQNAVSAVNAHLTVRNWLIWFYIVEFEQNGDDRAKYGAKLLQNLADTLAEDGLSYRNLKLFRQFYQAYPQISVYIPFFFENFYGEIRDKSRNKFQLSHREGVVIRQSLTAQLKLFEKSIELNRQTLSAQFELPQVVQLVHSLSFSHFSLLLPIDNETKRRFYEIECVKGTWSVRELKRQIDTLYFERSGMSRKPELLSKTIHENRISDKILDIIKSPFTFEFPGLKAKDVVYETDLEKALIEHLEEFLMELGNGFCFEARQKRMIIGGEYYFCDLVFYHRILKCHVLVELKVDSFSHEHIGQLKTYVNYYRKEVMRKDDNPPVGILLVTNKNDALVEYATADIDHELFVSKYLVELPDKKQLIQFINEEYAKI